MELYSHFLEQSQDLLIVLSAAKEIQKVNQAWRNILGYDPKDVHGRLLSDFIYSEDKEDFIHELNATEFSAPTKMNFVRMNTKNSSWRWIEFQIQFLGHEKGYIGIGREVGDFVRTQMMLDHQKREISNLVACLDDVVIEVDQDYVFQNVWTSNDKLLFFPRDKFLGKKIKDISEDLHKIFQPVIDQVIQYGGYKIIEYQHLQDSSRWFAAKVALIQNTSLDEKRRLLLSIRESTEKRRITMRKDELFRDLTEVLEQAPVGLVKVSREGQVVLHNGRLLDLLGITDRQLKYMSFQDLCKFITGGHPDIITEVLNGEKSSFDGDIRLQIEKQNIVLRLRMSPIYDERKKITHIMGIIEDVTEQRGIQQALSESHNLFKVLTESSPVMILMFDPNGLCSYCNTPWLNFTQSLMTIEVGEGWRNHFHPNEEKQHIAAIQAAFVRRTSFEVQCQLKRHDGQYRWFIIRGVPYYDISNEFGGFIATGIDIHESKNQEMKLLQTSKMASLGEMAGGIAHEINNPMAIILGNIQNLQYSISTGQANQEKILDVCGRIEKTCFRVAKIIQGLRSFSRSGGDDPIALQNLRSIVDDTLSLCEERFKVNDIKFTCDEIPEVIIECRPVQISQVILNLLNNSFDAVRKMRERWITLKFVVDETWIEIRVTDSGKGIEKEHQARLMEPFFTTKPVGQGTGLGLSISKGIIESHKGELFYDESAPNTTFVVRLLRA